LCTLAASPTVEETAWTSNGTRRSDNRPFAIEAFLYAALIFDGPIVSRIDDRRDYGEVRVVSMGMVGDECFVVVHTQREDRIRLILGIVVDSDPRKVTQQGLMQKLAEGGKTEG
jgi:hypothetical protein